jgi:hypothetical protein
MADLTRSTHPSFAADASDRITGINIAYDALDISIVSPT